MRAFDRTWYADVVTAVPPVVDGMIGVPEGAGLGLDIHPDLDRRFSLERRISRRT